MRIAKIRKEKGYTEKTSADAVGVSVAAVGMWETGVRTPRVLTLIKIADTLNCSVEELIRKEE